MTSACNHLAKADAVLVAQVEAALPALAATRLLVDRFVAMVRNGTVGDLTVWLNKAMASEIASFSRGLAADQAAVVAALTEPWSNGQTEGQINRLKTLKRQMYGRANIELLKARLVPHHEPRDAPTLIQTHFWTPITPLWRQNCTPVHSGNFRGAGHPA
jgi:ethanolamine ammonia-lyase large subunit